MTERIALISKNVVINIITCTEKNAEILRARGDCDAILILEKDTRAAIDWLVTPNGFEEPPAPPAKTVEEIALESAAAFKTAFETAATIEALAVALVTEHLKAQKQG